MTAEAFPSRASEKLRPQRSGEAVNVSGPVKSVEIFPSAPSTLARPAAPSTSSANRTAAEEGNQASQLAEAFMPGVRLRGSPPEAGMTKTSPPVEPSSLMIPGQNAIAWPSGDHRGPATRRAGL